MGTLAKKKTKRVGDTATAADRRHAAPLKTRDRGDVSPDSEDGVASGRKPKASGGDPERATDGFIAAAGKNKRKKANAVVPAIGPLPPSDGKPAGDGGEASTANEFCGASICQQLAELSRRRSATIKSRNMIDNQTAALVALELGYFTGLEEKDRKALHEKARGLMRTIYKGGEIPDDCKRAAELCGVIVFSAMDNSGTLDAHIASIEKEMVKLAKQLPVAKWCDTVRGFGIKSLAVILGETGDLSSYSNPAKVWKRLGLAPIKGKMPSTWRREGGLSADEWTEIGYSPRRRSLVYAMVGENIVKSNRGEYRQRYDEAKAKAAAAHEDWTKLHCHMHAMLLASKRLIRDLWREWNPGRGQESAQ